MKILVISNEYSNLNRVGNPIVNRIITSMKKDDRIDDVDFAPFTNKISDLFKIRSKTAGVNLVHILFGGLYALIIWVFLIGINCPKVITFHGTDLHAGELATTKSFIVRTKIRLNRLASIISILLFDSVGVVSESLISFVPSIVLNRCRRKIFVQPLGGDFDAFQKEDVEVAQKKLGLEKGKYI